MTQITESEDYFFADVKTSAKKSFPQNKKVFHKVYQTHANHTSESSQNGTTVFCLKKE
jgi:hypothetical protein